MYRKIECFGRWLNNIGFKTQNVGNYGPWKNLPGDLMEKIALKLNSTDYIRNSMVCKSWQSLLLQSDILRPQFPWLLLPHHSSKHTIKLYSVSENKFHTFHVDGGNNVVGCSKGWVIFKTVGSKISLFNPISGAKCILSSLPTALSLQRVELSSSIISECTVVAIVGDLKGLAFCRLGDEKWEFISIFNGFGQVYTLSDIVFCRQKLYVLVNGKTITEKIENITINLPNYGKAIPITLIPDINYGKSDSLQIEGISYWVGFKVFWRYTHVSYIVESIKGHVLLIQKYTKSFYNQLNDEANIIHDIGEIIDGDEIDKEDNENDETEANYATFENIAYSCLDRFKVYEIEDLAREERLPEDLGKKQVLFLSSKTRLVLPTTTSNELQGNCINFIVEHESRPNSHPSFWTGMSGTYHLNDSTIKPLNPKFQFCWNPKFMWFAPNFRY